MTTLLGGLVPWRGGGGVNSQGSFKNSPRESFWTSFFLGAVANPNQHVTPARRRWDGRVGGARGMVGWVWRVVDEVMATVTVMMMSSTMVVLTHDCGFLKSLRRDRRWSQA